LDVNGKVFFSREILEDFKGEKCEIPKVFRSNLLQGVNWGRMQYQK